MQDSALLISGDIDADNVLTGQDTSGLNLRVTSDFSIDLGSNRDIGEGHPLFLKIVAASGASAADSANYNAWNTDVTYVLGEKCSYGGVDYNCIQSADTSIGNPSVATTYWEQVPNSIEIQLIAATNEELTAGVSVLGTTGPISVYPRWSKTATYAIGDKVTYQGVNYRCSATVAAPLENKGVNKAAYWDVIGTGISDGLTTYISVPPAIGLKGKRYLGARYLNIGDVTGSHFIAELTTEISDPTKCYSSGFTVL